jgi:hypothetical protein
MEGGIQNCTGPVDLSVGVSRLVRAGDRFCKVELCEGCVGPVWGVTSALSGVRWYLPLTLCILFV